MSSINFRPKVYEQLIENFTKTISRTPVTKSENPQTGEEVLTDGTAVDISSYTTKEFFLVDPAGAASTAKTAIFDSDGTDGKLKYTILTTEIDTSGNWNVFARIAKTGSELTSDPLEFRVKARLD